MPEIITTLPIEPVEMTDEMMELEAMYAEICEMWSM
jgi:hypothetical protein